MAKSRAKQQPTQLETRGTCARRRTSSWTAAVEILGNGRHVIPAAAADALARSYHQWAAEAVSRAAATDASHAAVAFSSGCAERHAGRETSHSHWEMTCTHTTAYIRRITRWDVDAGRDCQAGAVVARVRIELTSPKFSVWFSTN